MAASPSIIAIIPARSGSQRIPGKNLLPLAGKPMLAWSIEHAKQAKCVSGVYVSTDDKKIAAVARQYGAEVIMRPASLAGSKASSESAVLHVLDERSKQGLVDPHLVVFLQCTSPVRAADDIDKAVAVFKKQKADSLFSACRDLGLFWSAAGTLRPINYDPQSRKMEQDRREQFRENGSIFVFKPSILRQTGSRIGGKIALYEMPFLHSFQIDEAEDIGVTEWVLRRMGPRAIKRPALVVFDFDGVFTDNTVLVKKGKKEEVRCHRGDSWGISRLKRAKVPALVLSTEKHAVVAERCAKMGIECRQGFADKATFLRGYLKTHKINAKDVLYVGNDLNDLQCMQMVGMPVAVADAEPGAMDVALWVTPRAGGKGAVRDVCEAVLAAKN